MKFPILITIKGRVQKKKVIFITLGSDPPQKKLITIFLATRPFFEHFWKKVYFFPLKIPKHLEKFQKIGVGDAKCHAHC